MADKRRKKSGACEAVAAVGKYARAIYPYKADKATSGNWPIFKVQ
jgi:hypothetical protein